MTSNHRSNYRQLRYCYTKRSHYMDYILKYRRCNGFFPAILDIYCEDKIGKQLELSQSYCKTPKKNNQEEFEKLCGEISHLNNKINSYISEGESFSDIGKYIDNLFLASRAVEEARLVAKRLSLYVQSDGIIDNIKDDIEDIELTLRRMLRHATEYRRSIEKSG